MSWLGIASEFDAFGAVPVELDVDLDAHEGPTWAIASVRGRSGWLSVADARLPMPFAMRKRALIACVDDRGEAIAPAIAEALFALPTSLPRPADELPPDQLDEVMEALFAGLLKRAKRDNLAHLARAHARTGERIAAFEADCRAFEDRLTGGARALRQERRSSSMSGAVVAAIDARLARLAAMVDELGSGMRDHIRAMRTEDDALEEAVVETLDERGHLQHRFTVRWHARGRRGCPPVRVRGRRDETELWRLAVADQSTLVRSVWVDY